MKTIMITGIAGGFGKTGKNAAAVAELAAAGAILIEMDVTDTASTAAGIAEMLTLNA